MATATDIGTIIILRSAFVNAGYKPINKNESLWCKPVGFGAVMVEIGEDEIVFAALVYTGGNPNVYGSSAWKKSEILEVAAREPDGQELFDWFVFKIACMECGCNTGELLCMQNFVRKM